MTLLWTEKNSTADIPRNDLVKVLLFPPHFGRSFTGCLFFFLLFTACGLSKRSPLRSFHPKAELFLESASEGVPSPDGKYLAFVRSLGGRAWNADLFLLQRETGEIQRLTNNPDYDGQPSWAPNSELLVYTSRRGGTSNLFLLSIIDGASKQLTWGGGSQPDFSPDGVSIVYVGEAAGNADLFVTSPRGGLSQQITKHPAKDRFPRYSPSGRWLAFSSDRLGTEDIFLLDLTTKKMRRLTDLPGSEVQPCWAPDSRTIVFSGTVPSRRGTPKRALFSTELPTGDSPPEPHPLTQCIGTVYCLAEWPRFGDEGARLFFTVSTTPVQTHIASIETVEFGLATRTPAQGDLTGEE